jgi:hypothetical protein
MRTLTTKELTVVSGGRNGGDIPPHVQRELEQAYRNSRSQGLSHADAMRACRLLGEGLELAAGRLAPGSSTGINAVCETAARTQIRALDRSISLICEQLDGGRWDSQSRTCIR